MCTVKSAAARVFAALNNSRSGCVATWANRILAATRLISHEPTTAAQPPVPNVPPPADDPTASAMVTNTMTPSVRRSAMSSWKARAKRPPNEFFTTNPWCSVWTSLPELASARISAYSRVAASTCSLLGWVRTDI